MICNKFERLAPGQESLVMSRLHITSSGKMKLQLLHLEFMFILKWAYFNSFQTTQINTLYLFSKNMEQ